MNGSPVRQPQPSSAPDAAFEIRIDRRERAARARRAAAQDDVASEQLRETPRQRQRETEPRAAVRPLAPRLGLRERLEELARLSGQAYGHSRKFIVTKHGIHKDRCKLERMHAVRLEEAVIARVMELARSRSC